MTIQGVQSVRLGEELEITFHRTCRVPRVEGQINSLPASLGRFPVFRVSDFAGNTPADWKSEGHFMPIYPHEAMWVGFNRPTHPLALVVGAGMVNAVTGEHLTETLSDEKQNYLVVPPQPWIDGFKPSAGDKVYQFVAAQLGSGETAGEQILGTAEFGGLQFGVFTSKVPLIPASRPHEYVESGGFKGGGMFGGEIRYRGGGDLRSMKIGAASLGASARSMGLGAGGSIRQKIYPDPYLQGRNPSDVWHENPVEKAYIYMVDARDFAAITGRQAPPSPVTYQTYQEKGLPWFGLPDGGWGDTPGGKAIDDLKPVSGNPDPILAGVTPDPKTKDLW